MFQITARNSTIIKAKLISTSKPTHRVGKATARLGHIRCLNIRTDISAAIGYAETEEKQATDFEKNSPAYFFLRLRIIIP